MNKNEDIWYVVKSAGIDGKIDGVFFTDWIRLQGFEKTGKYADNRFFYLNPVTMKYMLHCGKACPTVTTVNKFPVTSWDFKKILCEYRWKEAKGMFGAVFGDVVGSPYEFDRGNKSKHFEMFNPWCQFTDDTVMTVAVAEALLEAGKDASAEEISAKAEEAMRRWGREYPDAGYGVRFFRWLELDDPKPYGSFGNGSAMRVSAAGWLYDTIERTREAAKATAIVSHNHPEGIKGAEAAASVIFLSRNGKDKDYIKKYVEDEFGYDLSRTCDEIRPDYYHVETCQETLPEAITAFLEGNSFEDVVRTAVSLGGDCDTLTDIAAAMAEAYYGMPKKYVDWVKEKLPSGAYEILERIKTR